MDAHSSDFNVLVLMELVSFKGGGACGSEELHRNGISGDILSIELVISIDDGSDFVFNSNWTIQRIFIVHLSQNHRSSRSRGHLAIGRRNDGSSGSDEENYDAVFDEIRTGSRPRNKSASNRHVRARYGKNGVMEERGKLGKHGDQNY